MSEIINGFINKEGTIFEFENSGQESSECQINREEVEQIISETQPATHTHTIAQVDELQDALDGKAAVSHTHTKSQITDFPIIDDIPQNNSTHLISSKAVYDALKALSIKLSFAASYSSGTATSLSSFTTSETFDSVGMFTGNVRVSRSRGNEKTPLAADVPVMVQVLNSTNVEVYYNNALFAHLSGTTWTIDYDGGLLIPLYYGEPAPSVDNTKYITVPPVGATTQNVNAYFWFDHGDYSVWKQTSGLILIVNSTTPTTSDSAVVGQVSEFFNDEVGDLYWKSEIPDDYAAITNKGTSYSILDVHLS